MNLKVWDIQTRITHWALAICVVLNLFFVEGGELHDWLGYIAAALIIFRLTWSFFGSRFTHHNKLASTVYFSIWGMVIALGITGWMMSLDRYWGEEWLEDLHENISVTLQIFIGLHLLGVTLDSLRFKRKTWMSMITGRRP